LPEIVEGTRVSGQMWVGKPLPLSSVCKNLTGQHP